MKDYVWLLYIQVIYREEELKGSAKIPYVRHQSAAGDTAYIIHSVTVYKFRNLQAFSNFVKLATFQSLTSYQMIRSIRVSGKRD